MKRIREFWYMEVPSCTEWKIDNALVSFNPNCFVEVGLAGVEAKDGAFEPIGEEDILRG